MLLASHQPNYLPNLGFFYKIAHSDLFVVFSNIQFSRGEGWQRRHKLPSTHGDLWLTVPIHASPLCTIKEVKVDNLHAWKRQHQKTIEQLYRKTPEQEALSKIAAIYEKPWERLADLNFATIEVIKNILGINTRTIFDEEVGGEKEDLFINLCKKYDADSYLSGMGGKLYMTDRHFAALEQNQIDLRFVEKDLTSLYPYSSIHYILTEGVETVRSMLGLPAPLKIESRDIAATLT